MDDKQFKYDIIANKIIDMIANGDYKPGDKLPPEIELTRLFDVSRVTLRESLKKLSMMGILSIVQGSGTFVEEIKPADFMQPLFPLLAFKSNNIEEVYNVRIYIESGACEMAAMNRSDEDIADLNEMVMHMEEAIASENYSVYNEKDHHFHLAIQRACKNEVMRMIFGLFWNFIEGYVPKINTTKEIVEGSMVFHRLIYGAIRDKRSNFAATVMREHLHQAKWDLLHNMGLQAQSNESELNNPK